MSALAALLIAAPMAVSPGPVSVPVLLAHLHDWNGRQVEVRGWLHGCGASVPNLSGRCYLTPSPKWRQGRGRLKLAAFPHLADGPADHGATPAIVRGTIEEGSCPADAICLDGESDLRVDAVRLAGRGRS